MPRAVQLAADDLPLVIDIAGKTNAGNAKRQRHVAIRCRPHKGRI